MPVREVIEYDHEEVLRALEAHTCGLRGWGAAQATLTVMPGSNGSPATVEAKVTRVPSPADRD
jgi:hypothetical protein